MANAFLEAEVDRLDDPAATSDFTALAQRLDRILLIVFRLILVSAATRFFGIAFSRMRRRMGCH
jgi:hypothetical protein